MNEMKICRTSSKIFTYGALYLLKDNNDNPIPPPTPSPPKNKQSCTPVSFRYFYIIFLFSDIWGYNNYVTVKGISVCFGDSVGKPNTTKNCGIYQKITHFD